VGKEVVDDWSPSPSPPKARRTLRKTEKGRSPRQKTHSDAPFVGSLTHIGISLPKKGKVGVPKEAEKPL